MENIAGKGQNDGYLDIFNFIQQPSHSRLFKIKIVWVELVQSFDARITNLFNTITSKSTEQPRMTN